MTTEQRKEETRKKFEKFCNDNNSLLFVDKRSKVFNFFYSEIEARDKEIDALNDDVRGYRNGHELNSKRYIEALSKLQRLEEIIKAADKIIGESAPIWRSDSDKWEEYYKLIDAYNKLKSKLPSGI